jgi:hypothetical protein
VGKRKSIESTMVNYIILPPLLEERGLEFGLFNIKNTIMHAIELRSFAYFWLISEIE